MTVCGNSAVSSLKISLRSLLSTTSQFHSHLFGLFGRQHVWRYADQSHLFILWFLTRLMLPLSKNCRMPCSLSSFELSWRIMVGRFPLQPIQNIGQLSFPPWQHVALPAFQCAKRKNISNRRIRHWNVFLFQIWNFFWNTAFIIFHHFSITLLWNQSALGLWP